MWDTTAPDPEVSFHTFASDQVPRPIWPRFFILGFFRFSHTLESRIVG
jgi:hypothetical protein